MTKKSRNDTTVEVKAAPEATPASTTIMDPFDRFGLGELVHWPTWFGRRWPERLFGELEGIKLEEYRDGDNLIIRGEIPGVDPAEDIEVSVDNDRLSIRAERESRVEDDEDGYRSEFHYGSFVRVVTLPEGAKAGDIDASYTDGILEVRIPLQEDEDRKSKKITVKRG